jgi:FkbH-like protein
MASTNTPVELVENFVAAAAQQRLESSQLLSWIKGELKAGNAQAVWDVFPKLIVPDLDYTTASSFSRILKQLRKTERGGERVSKIAILGGSTTHQLVDLLDLWLCASRIRGEIYEADYGVMRQEILDPSSGLHEFRPDFVIIASGFRDLGRRPELTDDRAEADRKVEAEVAEWKSLWRVAHDRLGCQIIQNNFDSPAQRPLGNLDARHPGGIGRFIARVNQGLVDEAPAYVTIHDLDQLSASAGRWSFGDERFYHHAKLPCAPEHLFDYAHSLSSLVVAQLGLGKKCLALDLDNTLWGGVIGDDGLAGIRLGQGDPESEAYAAFQSHLKALRRRGVILAVCSKNTESIAREAFEKHPEMVLKLEDISCFLANWDDKATNLSRIAAQLNIGLNSLVFVDDNPVERSIARRLQPEVAVPEMPEDPSYYVRALERHRYFQALTLSSEDLARTDFYRADTERQALESSAEDLNAFLVSLELVARIGPVVPATLERTVQLINRSNQFNVTTKRYSNADLLGMLDDPAWVTRTVALQDRFGDNGLISVLLTKAEHDALVIDTWLMSCRVLKRGVEAFVLNHLVALAKSRGLSRLVGEYIPTAKNGIVRDLYHSLGFSRTAEDEKGQSSWELTIDDAWQPQVHYIREVQSDG